MYSVVLLALAMVACRAQSLAGPNAPRTAATAAANAQAKTTAADNDLASPAVNLGEVLYRETRFAQYFYANNTGINTPLLVGDPVMDWTTTTSGSLPGPYKGYSMNCATCHLIQEFTTTPGFWNRTYADFTRRSPIPDRGDGKYTTVRNAPPMVGAMRQLTGQLFLHWDGEFASGEDLVRGGFTGRNFGWLASETAEAISHVANVVRQDDGTYTQNKYTGGVPYSVIFLGTDASIPADVRLPSLYRLDAATATDEQVLDAVAAVVNQYVNSLTFHLNDFHVYDSSPYDKFLLKNRLPGRPVSGQSLNDYTAALTTALAALTAPQFVDSTDGSFAHHPDHTFVFGQTELDGLNLFLGRSSCAGCHPAPDFTDFQFHNTGAAQEEYDNIWGQGAFAQLPIPSATDRQADPNTFLPASAAYPDAVGIYRSVPSPYNPLLADLGLWNVYANSNMPLSQAPLTKLLCPSGNVTSCTSDQLLPLTVARFKTSGLRDLADSWPYLHTGQKDSIEEVVTYYIRSVELAQQGLLVNSEPLLEAVSITDADVAPLTAFLNALTEDYTD